LGAQRYGELSTVLPAIRGAQSSLARQRGGRLLGTAAGTLGLRYWHHRTLGRQWTALLLAIARGQRGIQGEIGGIIGTPALRGTASRAEGLRLGLADLGQRLVVVAVAVVLLLLGRRGGGGAVQLMLVAVVRSTRRIAAAAGTQGGVGSVRI